MGDPTPPQLPGGGFDQTILMMVIAQAKKPTFKKPFQPVQKFQAMSLAARGASHAGSAASLMHLGFTATDYSQARAPVHEESPSLGVLDRQRTEHHSQGPTKKTSQSSAKKDGERCQSRDCSEEGGRSQSTSRHPLDKGSDKDWAGTKHKSKSSYEHKKTASKSKGRAPAMGQGSGQAGPSHGSWPALPMGTGALGTKRGVLSKLPKKVEAKMVHQMSVQQLTRYPMPT